MTKVEQPALTGDLLARCASRAATYDRKNRFFEEDFQELREAGYLIVAVPREFGGRGLSLVEIQHEQRRLAYHAPATALGVHMHLIWTGIAADLWRAGDASLEWLLKEAVDGGVFAFGHAERGSNFSIFQSTTKAQRVEGGYRFFGHKMFGTLSPVWTRYGLHAMDADDPRGPQIIHALMPRDAEGYRIEPTWDTLGMRATASNDTVLDGVFVPNHLIARIIPANTGDPFLLSLFAWGLTGFANIYYAIARRAFDLAVASLKKRASIDLSRPLAYHPEFQHTVADMALELEAVEPHVDRIMQDWVDRVDHGTSWPAKLVAVKHRSVNSAWRVVDLAMDLSGGKGMFKGEELERLFRDARCGRFHPATSALTHEIVGKTALGIDWLVDQPRWG